MNVVSIVTTLGTATVGAFFGALVTHFFGLRRDVAVKRREIILPHLMLALDEIEKANTARTESDIVQLEKAISRIQMVGDPNMVKTAHKVVVGITENGAADTTDLYFLLRDKVRQELRLQSLEKKYMALAFTFPDKKGHEK